MDMTFGNGGATSTRLHCEVVDVLRENGCMISNSNKVPTRIVRNFFYQMLENRRALFFGDIDASQVQVGIESQMKQKMVALETVAWGWFKFQDFDVKTIHPTKKFKIALAKEYPRRCVKSYKNNKAYAVDLCTRFLTSSDANEVFREKFLQQKKKDDLSDCFLQALWMVEEYKRHKEQHHVSHNMQQPPAREPTLCADICKSSEEKNNINGNASV